MVVVDLTPTCLQTILCDYNVRSLSPSNHIIVTLNFHMQYFTNRIK